MASTDDEFDQALQASSLTAPHVAAVLAEPGLLTPLSEEDAEVCPWQVSGNYPDSPPEYCELDLEPGSEYCPEHTAAAKDMDEWEKRFPPDVEDA